MLQNVSQAEGEIWGRRHTLMALFDDRLFHAISLALCPKIVWVFFNLSTLNTSVSGDSLLVGMGMKIGVQGSYLLLVTPPAKPQTIVEIVPSFTASLLPTDPAGDVLHLGQRASFLEPQRVGWR